MATSSSARRRHARERCTTATTTTPPRTRPAESPALRQCGAALKLCGHRHLSRASRACRHAHHQHQLARWRARQAKGSRVRRAHSQATTRARKKVYSYSGGERHTCAHNEREGEMHPPMSREHDQTTTTCRGSDTRRAPPCAPGPARLPPPRAARRGPASVRTAPVWCASPIEWDFLMFHSTAAVGLAFSPTATRRIAAPRLGAAAGAAGPVLPCRVRAV